MNKYLTKLAAPRGPRKPTMYHELEPGVQYESIGHNIKVDKEKSQEIKEGYKRKTGLILGAEGALYGGVFGAVGGKLGRDKLISKSIEKHMPSISVAGQALPEAVLKMKRYTKYLPHAAGVVGAAALGIPSYMLAKHYHDPKLEYEGHIGKLERKHEKAIHKIEGWDE